MHGRCTVRYVVVGVLHTCIAYTGQITRSTRVRYIDLIHLLNDLPAAALSSAQGRNFCLKRGGTPTNLGGKTWRH